MSAAPEWVEIDGRRYRVAIDGGLARIDAADGTAVTLRPWTLRDHLAALEAAVYSAEGRLRFDPSAFAREVLRRAGGEEVDESLAPIALWWVGAGVEDASVDAAGWLELSIGRARVRPWSWAERAAATEASAGAATGGEVSVATFLASMVRASLVALEPGSLTVDALTGADACRVLAAIVACNSADGPLEAALEGASTASAQAMATQTLLVCRALGWTPSQVWAAPAVEIERLLRLLEIATPTTTTTTPPRAAPEPRRRRGLASHPDAVIIEVRDDS